MANKKVQLLSGFGIAIWFTYGVQLPATLNSELKDETQNEAKQIDVTRLTYSAALLTTVDRVMKEKVAFFENGLWTSKKQKEKSSQEKSSNNIHVYIA